MSTLSFKKINKIYDNKVHAVVDFDLEINDKEFIVFVGPSGCGKSTTLRMVAGLEDITSGDLYIDDVRVNSIAPKNRNIAMVFQSYALYPHMTVYDNMAFSLRMRKVPIPVLDANGNQVYEVDRRKISNFEKKIAALKAEGQKEAEIAELQAQIEHEKNNPSIERKKYRHHTKQEIDEKIKRASEILGLEPYLERKPGALSGGQSQRAALGRAIVRNPKVFLMDEPLSNLDAKLRSQMRNEIIKIHQRVGATTIYVTHDQTEAMTMADRIVIMKDGYVQQIGPPKDVYMYPANMFVAGFIGSPAMNFFNGVFDGKNFIFDGEKKLKIKLNAAHCKLLKDYISKKVVLGIRPEEFYLYNAKDTKKSTQTLQVECEFCELLGYEIIVYGHVDGQKILIKISSKNDVKQGDVNKYGLDFSNIHFFDAETTETIK
ncbi:MAG: ATP-binding cassette domain-containing protein [Bacilli bacterium]|jgi:multiple sugar transport system ATP-binding protein|nr:ATP-binding cassette domain-containing protein [Bacilli bacterium]